jgi:UDP-N-acetylmuramoyl-tripeptide--D-alanyl-D-alanine ligase
VRQWPPEQVARLAGGRLVAGGDASGGPQRVSIDSRDVRPGDLFVGIRGERVDGGAFAQGALEAGAWGVIVEPQHAEPIDFEGVVVAVEDPVVALGSLARAWRDELACPVVAITGSVGKTSTKDVLAAMLRQRLRTVANAQNLNTEIGLPLTILGAPPGTEALVLEMGMRGSGQIGELTAIARPNVGVITAIGPVHLELLGTIEAIASAKAELIAGLAAGQTAVVPVGEALLAPHLRDDLQTVTFGAGGDVDALPDTLTLPFDSAHMRRNALAALAAARALGVEPSGALEVELSDRRGQRETLPGDILVIDDCYNANPMSMRAALDDLAATAHGRRVAVLGDMLELGPDERRWHREIGEHARASGVDVLVTVGPLAAEMDGDHAAPDAAAAAELTRSLVAAGDTVLIKASRGVGLEVVAAALRGEGR